MCAGGSIVIRVPMRVYLLSADAEAPQPTSQEDALSGPKVGSSVESPPNRLPGKLPPADESAGQSLLQVCLDVEAAKAGRASTIPNDSEVVTDNASRSLRRRKVGKQGESGPAANNFGNLRVVDAGQGNAGMCEEFGGDLRAHVARG